MKKYTYFIFGGGGGVLEALTSNPGERKCQGSKISSQIRHMYDKGKNNHQFFIYGPSYPLTYINLQIKYGSNPIRFAPIST